jgi:hypothetical protein
VDSHDEEAGEKARCDAENGEAGMNKLLLISLAPLNDEKLDLWESVCDDIDAGRCSGFTGAHKMIRALIQELRRIRSVGPSGKAENGERA